jgi:hypothetical protein
MLIEEFLVYKIQVLSIMGSLFLTFFIARLIKRKKLREEYSLLWLCFSLLFVILSVFRPLLEMFADFVGIIYAPAALLLMLVVSVFFILIQFSMVMSTLTEQNKILVQELAILKTEVKNLSDKVLELNNDK